MKKLRGPSMRLRHMLSYVLVAVIPLLVCAAIVTYANHVEGRQNILKGLTESLQTARARLDLQIKSLENVCLHFSSGRFSGDDSDAHGIAAQLRSYQANYPFVEFLAYLPRGGTTLITPSGVSDYRALQQNFPTISLDLTQFYSKSHQLLASAMLYTRKPIGYTGWGDYLIYLHPVPMLDEAPTGTLAFFLNKQTYTDVILDCMGLNGYYAVMDANMNLLYDHDTPGAHPEVLGILAKMKGTAAQRAVVQGAPYVLLRTISESTGMYYMAAFQETTLFADLNGSMFQLCLLFLCAALAMGLVALWMGRRLFLPLQRLADDIAPAKTHPEANLLERIRAVYQDVSGQNDLLQRQAQAHLVIARQQLLLSLLHGSYASTLDLTGQLRQAGMDPEGKMLTVLVTRLETKPQLSEDCLLEAVSVTALPDGMAYAVAPEQSGLYTWVLVTPRPDDASQDARRLALAEQLSRQLASHVLSTPQLGVGGLYDEPCELVSACIEAHTALRSRTPAQNIALWQPSPQGDILQAFLPLADKALLCQCLQRGQQDVALATLSKMVADLKNVASNHVLVRSWCFFLYDAVASTLADLQAGSVDSAKLAQHAALSSLEVFERKLRQVIIQACALVLDREKQRAQTMDQRVLQYVQIHYGDYGLSLEKLEAEFGLSESSITQLFRRCTGYSFLQYLSILRMETVKRHLVQTDALIKDIVHQAGYADAASFTRKFRQLEGMTPQAYRNWARSQI